MYTVASSEEIIMRKLSNVFSHTCTSKNDSYTASYCIHCCVSPSYQKQMTGSHLSENLYDIRTFKIIKNFGSIFRVPISVVEMYFRLTRLKCAVQHTFLPIYGQVNII